MSDLSIVDIKKQLTNLLPDEKYRKKCFLYFVESIHEAHSYGQNKWGVYSNKQKIRLLVGNLILLTIHKKGIWISLDKQSLNESKERYLMVSNSKHWEWETDKYSEYNPIPSKHIVSVNGYYRPSNNDLDMWPIIKELHFNYIKKVSTAYKQLKITSQVKHSNNLIRYLKEELNITDIPTPSYHGIDFTTADEIPLEDKEGLFEGGIKQGD